MTRTKSTSKTSYFLNAKHIFLTSELPDRMSRVFQMLRSSGESIFESVGLGCQLSNIFISPVLGGKILQHSHQSLQQTDMAYRIPCRSNVWKIQIKWPEKKHIFHYLEVMLIFQLLRKLGQEGSADIEVVVSKSFWFSLQHIHITRCIE